MKKQVDYFLLFILLVQCLSGFDARAQQNCDAVFSGKIMCSLHHEPVGFAVVYLSDINRGATASDSGYFRIEGICPGDHHVRISFVGFITIDTSLYIPQQKQVVFDMLPSGDLKVFDVRDHKIKNQDVVSLQRNDLAGKDIEQTRGLTLAESLKSITGMNSIQTGPSISKPMIHGMYGNRVLIMNNGIRMEGQNWGADHAPEIDPFVAAKLSVIKGAASIRYGPDAIAGVVLVEPKAMPAARCLRGDINLVGASNGRSGATSGMMEGAFGKKFTGLSWRVQGTMRQAGSFSTPHYYLTNTALKENDYSGSLVYSHANFGAKVFYSSFNSTIGIYSGSHVGNLSDLLFLFNSPQPVVPSVFSYDIKRGYQVVHHNTIKAEGFIDLKKAGKLTYTFARQENKRSEFSEDVSYNQSIVDQNIPDSYFQLITHTSDLIWEHKPVHHITGSIGLSYITQGNVYKGLDFRALLPNYRNYGGGAFALEKWNSEKLTLEAGIRFDYLWMRTYTEDF
ncbi:MAG TPA: TonB-dependent receptor, partial [Bacteroidia bacterium]|nr:TonB-dependent receptor [Bacteroidia bacterium]